MDSAISLILEGFGGRAASPDKVTAYAIALEGLAAKDIAYGVRKILRGEVAGINPAFPPTAAQVAKACQPLTFLSAPLLSYGDHNFAPDHAEPEPVFSTDRLIADIRAKMDGYDGT